MVYSVVIHDVVSYSEMMCDTVNTVVYSVVIHDVASYSEMMCVTQ